MENNDLDDLCSKCSTKNMISKLGDMRQCKSCSHTWYFTRLYTIGECKNGNCKNRTTFSVYNSNVICNECGYEFKTAELDYNRYTKIADLNNVFVQLIRQIMEYE